MRLRPFVLILVLSGIGFPFPAHAKNWSYDGDQNGQDEWATLDKHYTACGSGTQQSPIEIGATQVKPLPPLMFHYAPSRATLHRKDYTLAVDVDGNATLTDNGQAYRLAEIRFHTPSEHVVLGRFWPLEIQLTHRDASGKTLIVAAFATTGAANTALEILLSHVADQTLTPPDITFNPADFLPPDQGYYAYTGSLTIPPCTEGVEWRVLKEPITVSQGQLAALEKITGRNARLPQPVYMRAVLESE